MMVAIFELFFFSREKNKKYFSNDNHSNIPLIYFQPDYILATCLN